MASSMVKFIEKKTMKINLSFNFKHENHIKIELNGFRFWRCIHIWCTEEYGHRVFQTDFIHIIPRYQPVIQFQTSKTTKIKFIALMSAHPPLIAWCKRSPITGYRYNPHTRIWRMWWNVHTTTALSQNISSSIMKLASYCKNQICRIDERPPPIDCEMKATWHHRI